MFVSVYSVSLSCIHLWTWYFPSQGFACVNWTRRRLFPGVEDAACHPATEDQSGSLFQLLQESRYEARQVCNTNRNHTNRDCSQESLEHCAKEKARVGLLSEEVLPAAAKENQSRRISCCLGSWSQCSQHLGHSLLRGGCHLNCLWLFAGTAHHSACPGLWQGSLRPWSPSALGKSLLRIAQPCPCPQMPSVSAALQLLRHRRGVRWCPGVAPHDSVCMASSVHQVSTPKTGLALALFHGQLIYSFRVLFCEIKEKAVIYAGNILKKQTWGWSLCFLPTLSCP